MTSTSFAPSELAVLGERIAEDGLDRLAEPLHRVASAARFAGIRPELAALVVDDSAPDVVRERAFAAVSAALVADREQTSRAARAAWRAATERTPLTDPPPVAA